jgi:ABC-type branched-subunit amino acid transport system ATPase component
MLKVDHLQVAYGKVQTLWDISFEVPQGEIVALIGPTEPVRRRH